jgi:hypothetical protein
MELVLPPTNKDPAARASALCKKIAALDSLASNFATTAAESESAQKAAQRLRLQLAQLVAAPEPDPSSERPEPALQGSASVPGGEPVRAASPRATWMWLWQLSSLALLAVLLVLLWPRAHGSAPSGSEPPARGNPLEAAGERSERERAAAAILAISRTRGAAAAAEAQRACRIRDLLREFQKTPGGVLHANEDSVDVRRRCGAYLSVRGFDEEACSPARDGNPRPQCPTGE